MSIFDGLRFMEEDISRRRRTPIEAAADAQAELAARVANDIRRWNRGSDRLEPGETYVVTEMDFERRPDGSYGLRGC